MEIKKVVTFRASSIGDCLMAKHLLENIRASYPNARCGIVVASRGAMIRDLLAAYPWIEVIEANRRSPRQLWRLLKSFLGSDLAITLYTGGTVTLPTKIMARLLAYRGMLVGYADRSALSKYIFDKIIPLPADRSRAPRLSESDALLAAGVPYLLPRLTLRYLPQPRLLGRLALRKREYVVVHLFSGAEARGLSPQTQQALIDSLAAQFPDTPLVFTGTRREHEKIRRLNLPRKAVLAETSVQEMAALIDDCAVMVSLGTGPSHMASCMRVPLAVMVPCQGLQWCGTDQYGDAPMSVFCRPEQCPSGHDYSGFGKCLEAIDMREVAARARDMASRRR